ncbi:MAG: S41 family peptidase [Gemmatimonadota bacterium]|nr:S41 family peptidase [Gemmatimonadota bacterium]
MRSAAASCRVAPLLVTVVLNVAPPLAAQREAVSDVERDQAGRMLSTLQAELQRYYFDSTFGGRDLTRLAWRAQATIDTASQSAFLLGALAQFMQDLNDSHTRFIPPLLTTEVDYGFGWKPVGDDCYVTVVRKGSDAEAQGIQVGDRLLAVDGIKPTRENSSTIYYVYHLLSPRPGLRLLVGGPDGDTRSALIMAKVKRHPQYLNATNLEHMRYVRDFLGGSGRLEHRFVTRDSVALWKFSSFGHKDGRIDKHMNDARKYPWLILDLRGNGGGSVEAITRLLGHFFAEPFEVLEQRWRDSTVRHAVEPRGKGGAYAGQVILLTDAESASASEITTRVLQKHRGATVVGDRTMGAVVASIYRPLADEASGVSVLFGATISVFDILMTDSTRLEGNGVMPNVAALPTGRDLAEGADPVMQFALELAGVRVSAAEAATIWK